MKITICDTHFTGNVSDNFNHERFIEVLETEYRKIALTDFPEAKVVVRIDVHEASGSAVLSFWSDIMLDAGHASSMRYKLEKAQSRLFDEAKNNPNLYDNT